MKISSTAIYFVVSLAFLNYALPSHSTVKEQAHTYTASDSGTSKK